MWRQLNDFWQGKFRTLRYNQRRIQSWTPRGFSGLVIDNLSVTQFLPPRQLKRYAAIFSL